MAQLFQLQGITIDKTFRPFVWQRFKASMHKYNIPVQLTTYDAAFMNFTLPLIIWQQQGYQPSIDRIWGMIKLKLIGKEVVSLKTVNQQLIVLASLKKRLQPFIFY